MRIEAKVAKILNDDEVVLNRGTLDHVDIGMVFNIGDDRLEGITDPDTGEDLGSIGSARPAFEIVRVGERASLAVRYRSTGDISLGLTTWSSKPRGLLGEEEWRQIQVGDVATHTGRKATRLF